MGRYAELSIDPYAHFETMRTFGLSGGTCRSEVIPLRPEHGAHSLVAHGSSVRRPRRQV